MVVARHAKVTLFVYAITASGSVFADCPLSMSTQLLQDCIIYEGGGAPFPPDDYAHMEKYQEWLVTQKAQVAQVKPIINEPASN